MTFATWVNLNSNDLGKLILRVSVSWSILLYGIEKITNPGMLDYIAGLFSAIHLPGFIAYGVFLGEVLAPVMVILGLRTRIASAIMSFTMVVVILLGHSDAVFPLTEFKWFAIEFQLLLLLSGVAVMFLGAGRFAVSSQSKWD